MARTRFALPRLLLTAVALTVAVTAITTPANAQYGQAAGIAKSTTPEYFRRDVLIFVEGLDLDETQRAIVEGLFDNYIEDFDAGFARVQQRLEDLRPELTGGDQQRVMRLVFSPFLDWFDEHDELGEQFLANVYSVLNDDQQAGWEKFRRKLRREKTLSEGTLSGERLNLVNIIREMRLDEETRERIASVLEAYEVELDGALKARNDSLKEGRTIMIESIQEDEHSKSVKLMREQVKHRVRVRDINFLYANQLAEALPEKYGTELRENSLEAAYPRVFRPTPTQRIYDAALKLEDLDEETRAQIEVLQLTYLDELRSMNETLLAASMETDPKQAIERAEAFAARMRGDRPARGTDPTRELFKQRDAVGLVYMQLMSDMLLPDVFASLPGASRLLNQNASEGQRSRAQSIPRTAEERREAARQKPRKQPPTTGQRGIGSDHDKKDDRKRDR